MPGLPVPESGVALGPVPAATGSGKSPVHGVQAMRLTFADTAILREMLKHEADLRISFGKSMRLMYGDQSMEILSQGEAHRHELYREGSPGELEFLGQFSHNLEVRELDESAQDESLLNLQKSYARIHDAKAASTTMVVDSSELPPATSARRYGGGGWKKGPKGKRQQVSNQTRSMSATSSMRPSSRSPAINIGDIPSTSSQTSGNLNAKLDALRIPIIHLLALGSTSERSLSSKTRATEELCLRILQRIANRVKAGKQWELMDDAFQELDVWDFPYKSQEDREKAIANCRTAFSRLRLPKDAVEWQMLLAPEDRGKVDPCPVSPIPSHPAPKATGHISSVTDTIASPVHPTQDHKKLNEETPRSTPQPSTTRKATQDPVSRMIKNKGKKAAAAVKQKGPIGRPPKSASTRNLKANAAPKQSIVNTNSKIKSAEKIVDSDEDVEMDDVVLASAETKPASPQVYARQAALKTPSVTDSDAEVDDTLLHPKKTALADLRKSPAKKPPTSAPASRSHKTTSPAISSGYVKAPLPTTKGTISKEQTGRRSASGSPPKPSPLGSSPPINASDVDNASASSSPSFSISNVGISTASQSPLGSLGGGRKPRYILTSSSSLKRKAAVSDPDDGVLPRSERKSAVPDPDDGVILRNERKSTVSDPDDGALLRNGVPLGSSKRQNSSSPDNYTIELARRFKENHAKYERLYKEAQITVDRLEKKARIDRVISMHRELESLKQQIAMAVVH